MAIDKILVFDLSFCFAFQNHTHLPLLTHVATVVEQEPWLLEQCGPNSLISFLSGFSIADFKPHNWDRLKPLVIKAFQGLMVCIQSYWQYSLLSGIKLCDRIGRIFSFKARYLFHSVNRYLISALNGNCFSQ
jgi:hypothetical protein